MKMMLTQETAVEVCHNIINILPLPNDQLYLESDSRDGYGVWTISNTGDDAWREFIVEEFLDPAIVLVRVVFHRNYMGLDGIMLGDKGSEQLFGEIFDLLLATSKELKMPLVIADLNNSYAYVIDCKKLKENVTRMITQTPYSTLNTFIISEHDLQEEHKSVAEDIWDCYKHESKMYTKDEYEAMRKAWREEIRESLA